MKEAKPDAWMPLYIGDWDGDTGHLSCEEDGAYMRLVRHYWRMGPPADNDAGLARIVRMDLRAWKKVRPAIVGYFQVGDGFWRHKRVDMELARWATKKATASAKAQAAAEKRWGKGGDDPGKPRRGAKGNAPSMPQALPEQCPSSSSTEVDAPTGQSTLCGRESVEARRGGASPLRVIEGGHDDSERGWLLLAAQARQDKLRFRVSDPGQSSECAEFESYANAQAVARRRAAA